MFQTPGILSSGEFRGFWITTEYVNKNLVIKVGKEGENEPFMNGLFVDVHEPGKNHHI